MTPTGYHEAKRSSTENSIQEPLPQKFPGLEDPNYTQIPNVFFDRMMRGMKPSKVLTLLYLMRRIYGFHKDGDAISFDQMRVGTGLAAASLRTAIAGLVKAGIVYIEHPKDERGGSLPPVYRLKRKPEGRAESDGNGGGYQNLVASQNLVGTKDIKKRTTEKKEKRAVVHGTGIVGRPTAAPARSPETEVIQATLTEAGIAAKPGDPEELLQEAKAAGGSAAELARFIAEKTQEKRDKRDPLRNARCVRTIAREEFQAWRQRNPNSGFVCQSCGCDRANNFGVCAACGRHPAAPRGNPAGTTRESAAAPLRASHRSLGAIQ